MGRTLEEMIAAETPGVQVKIEERYQQLVEEAKSLAEIRKLTANSQAMLAARLHMKQPTISRMERQVDMYLSTLRSYIEAAGGKLHLLVTLPDRHPVFLTGLGDITGGALRKRNVTKTVAVHQQSLSKTILKQKREKKHVAVAKTAIGKHIHNR